MSVLKEKEREPEQITETFRRSVASLDKLMMVVCDFDNGPASEPDPPHSHPHEQITYVVEGELFLFVGGKKFHLEPGDVYTIPSGEPHCIQNISKHVRLIDSFSPLREDLTG